MKSMNNNITTHFKGGQKLNKEELKYIKTHYKLSKHCKERLRERRPDLLNNIGDTISHCLIAYYNTDGSVNIAINKWEYFVIADDLKTVITFKEKSLNSISIFEKRRLASIGVDRKL